MKILIFNTLYYPNQIGGAEKSVQLLAEGLLSFGYEPIVVSTSNRDYIDIVHGLVSALSQGVTSLATGWSHKYKMLFQDYNFDEGLIDIMASDDELYRKIDLIIDNNSKQTIQKKLLERSQLLKKESQKMWDEVFKIIDKV